MKYLLFILLSYLASFCQQQEVHFSEKDEVLFESARYMCEKHHLSMTGWGGGREVKASLDLDSPKHLTEEQARELVLEGAADLICRWNRKIDSPIFWNQIIYHISLSYRASEKEGSVNVILSEGTLGYFHSGMVGYAAFYKEEEISSEELESLMKACEARLDKESIS